MPEVQPHRNRLDSFQKPLFPYNIALSEDMTKVFNLHVYKTRYLAKLLWRVTRADPQSRKGCLAGDLVVSDNQHP